MPTRGARAAGPARALRTFTAVAAITAAPFVAGVRGAIGAALVVATTAAWVDLRTRRLPNRLVALCAATAGLGLAVATASGTASASLGAIAGTFGFAGPLFLVHLMAPAAIGFGDVKLAAALGLAIGLVDPRLGVLALCIASGVTAAAGIATRRGSLPLGPGLVVGSVSALALGEVVWA